MWRSFGECFFLVRTSAFSLSSSISNHICERILLITEPESEPDMNVVPQPNSIVDNFVKCRVLIFNDHLYYIIQFILLSSIDHISITSTLIDVFFLFPHITHCIRHSLIMFTLWNLAPLFSLDTPPHTVQHRSLLHSLAYYLAHINLFNYDIIGIPVS